jgi:hypothetical protein
MEQHVRVCRDCGEEYRPDIVRCADCGGELEDRYPGEEVSRASGEPAPNPAADLAGFRALFMTPRATDLVPMAERLRQVTLEYRLAEQPGTVEGAPPRYALLVREADAATALAALAELVASQDEAADLHVLETRFDPELGYVQCPACGTDQARGAVECPECGLALTVETGGEEPGE